MFWWKRKKEIKKEVKSGPIIVNLTALESEKIYVMKITANVVESVRDFMEVNRDLLNEKKITLIFITEGMELYQIEQRILVSRN